jgi:RNA polymerase sigma-70 factor (ECF subfamily)
LVAFFLRSVEQTAIEARIMVETSKQAPQAQVELSDNELVARSLHGDMDAFGALIMRYRSGVIGVAYRLSGNIALAEDVAQETFIRVWEKLATFRPEGNFRGWLYRIASNLTIDVLRRKRPTADIQEVPVAAPEPDPEAAFVQRERDRAVRAALLRLPVHSRTILVLREYENLSYQEIADVLDIPLGTVKSRLYDARRRLKVELTDYLETQNTEQ